MIHRIAILADLHLPDRTDTIKESVLHWAMEELQRQKPEWILVAGDFTSIGTVRAAARFRKELESTGIPFLITSGNADCRTPSQTAALQETCLTDSETLGILLLDTSHLRLAEGESERLSFIPEDSNLFAVTHCPPADLPPEDAALLTDCIRRRKIQLLVTGHVHEHTQPQPGVITISGLDPDKSLGAPAGIVIFSRKQGLWEAEKIPCPAADPRQISPEQSAEFRKHLGIALRKPEEACLEDLENLHRIPTSILELPWISPNAAARQLHLLNSWKKNCQQKHILSLALPKLTAAPESETEFQQAVQFALECHANMVSCDIPDLPISQMQLLKIRQEQCQRYARLLQPLIGHGITVGIRNAHLRPGEWSDTRRKYGCTPQECREWQGELQQTFRNQLDIGVLLDLGHARANRKLATRFNLSEWYAEVGHSLCGIQLQQIHDLNIEKEAHQPILDWFEGLIPLAGLLMAWNQNQIRHVPLFLSARTVSAEKGFSQFPSLPL